MNSAWRHGKSGQDRESNCENARFKPTNVTSDLRMETSHCLVRTLRVRRERT